MKRRKQKPGRTVEVPPYREVNVPVPPAGASTIPHAEDVARALRIAWDIDAALERGRKIGRLEGIAIAFENVDPENKVLVNAVTARLVAPILRAEIARLKGETT